MQANLLATFFSSPIYCFKQRVRYAVRYCTPLQLGRAVGSADMTTLNFKLEIKNATGLLRAEERTNLKSKKIIFYFL